MAPLECRRVRVGKHTIAVDRRPGDGPALLLLHGIPGWRGTWRAVMHRLPPRLDVLAPDLIGFGASSPARGLMHAAEQAEVLHGMLDALAMRDVHLAGFDFGGPTAVLLARRLGRRARSLTLAATNVFPDTPIPAPLRLARVPALGALLFGLAFGRLGLALMWRAATGDRRRFPFRRYREALRSRDGRVSTRRIFHASLADLPRHYTEIDRALGELSLPALVLWGDRDPFFAVEVGRRTADRVGARLRVLEGCGHFVPEERADEMADELAAHVLHAGGAA
jgi:pimeloyl-ACP methyl ester carboxylesterase